MLTCYSTIFVWRYNDQTAAHKRYLERLAAVKEKYTVILASEEAYSTSNLPGVFGPFLQDITEPGSNIPPEELENYSAFFFNTLIEVPNDEADQELKELLRLDQDNGNYTTTFPSLVRATPMSAFEHPVELNAEKSHIWCFNTEFVWLVDDPQEAQWRYQRSLNAIQEAGHEILYITETPLNVGQAEPSFYLLLDEIASFSPSFTPDDWVKCSLFYFFTIVKVPEMLVGDIDEDGEIDDGFVPVRRAAWLLRLDYILEFPAICPSSTMSMLMSPTGNVYPDDSELRYIYRSIRFEDEEETEE